MLNMSLLSLLSTGLTMTATAGALVATTSTAALPLLAPTEPTDAPVATTEPRSNDSLEPSPSAETRSDSSVDPMLRDMQNSDIGGGNKLHDVKRGLHASGQAGGVLFSYVGPCQGSGVTFRVRGNNNQLLSNSHTPCTSNEIFTSNWVPWDTNTKNWFCNSPAPATAYRAEVYGLVTEWVPTPVFDCGGSATTPAPPAPTASPTPPAPTAPAPAPAPTPTPTPSPTTSTQPSEATPSS